MQEIFAHFPPSPTQQPSTIIGGQIFAVPYPVPVVREQTQESAVQDKDLNLRQVQTLEALNIFKQATADLITRHLRLSPNSVRHMQRLIYPLYKDAKEEDRYVDFLTPSKPKASRFGSSPYIYTLGRKGHRFLKKKGVATDRYRKPEEGMQEEVPLRHRMAVNEFLMKAIHLAEDNPDDLQLMKHFHEQYWLGHPLKVQVKDEPKPKGLSPDLLLAYESFHPLNQHWIPVEINQSREWEKDWIEKVRLYRYCLPAYKERLGTDILTTVAVMVTSPSRFPRNLYVKETEELILEKQLEARQRVRRMAKFREWTEKLLEEMKLRHHADLFSFSAAPLDELTPTELFFGKHWYIPFDDTPRSLIQLRKAGVS